MDSTQLIPVTQADRSFRTLVINADGKPLSLFPLSQLRWEDVVKNLYLNSVVPIHGTESQYVARARGAEINIPAVVMLSDYRRRGRTGNVKHLQGLRLVPACTSETIFVRDVGRCMVTGDEVYQRHQDPRYQASIDHFYTPKSKGGHIEWENALLMSQYWNSRKGDQCPRDFRQSVQIQPWVPAPHELLLLYLACGRFRVPEHWQPFVQQPQIGLSRKVERIMRLFDLEFPQWFQTTG